MQLTLQTGKLASTKATMFIGGPSSAARTHALTSSKRHPVNFATRVQILNRHPKRKPKKMQKKKIETKRQTSKARFKMKDNVMFPKKPKLQVVMFHPISASIYDGHFFCLTKDTHSK